MTAATAAASRRIRVLHVVGRYPSAAQPATQIFIKTQIESLAAIGIDCDVLVLEGRGWNKYRTGPSQIRKRLRVNPADLIHAHYSYSGWVSLGLGVPVVVSLLGTDLYGPERGSNGFRPLIQRAHRTLARYVVDRANASIVKSERMRVHLGRRCSVIPNGIDFDLFAPLADEAAVRELRQRLSFPTSRYYALFAGAPDNPVKRYALAEETTRIASAALGSPVALMSVHGRPQRELADYMRAADVLLLTSSHEGSPNVVKEAIASNLPVVSVDVGDVRTRVAACSESLVSDDDSPRALAAAMTRVLQRGRRDNGRESLRSLDLPTVAVQIREVYESVLQQSPTVRGKSER